MLFASAILIASVPLLQSASFGRQPSQSEKSEAILTVHLEDGKRITLKSPDIAKFPRETVKADDHGRQTIFTGVKLSEVLRLAGVRMGKQRGVSPDRYLLVEAADNYRVVIALAEFDSDYTDQIVLLADTRDSKPLSENEGPWRIVIPHEKIQARWIRQVKSLSILRPPSTEAK